METATKGKLLLGFLCAIFIYFTIWVLGTPFIDSDQPILAFFPDTYVALALPLFAGVLLIGVTLITIGAFLVHGELAKLGGGRKVKSS